MEEPSSHADNTGTHSGNAPHATTGVAASEEVGDGDPPAIPSASSSNYLTEKSVGESRYGNKTTTIASHNDSERAHANRVAHTLSIPALATQLKTDVSTGLSTAEAERLLQEHGPNRLEASGGTTWWRILIRQVANSLTVVLALAMIVSWVTLDFIEGGVIAAVIILNIVVGFSQDYRAEQTIQSLLALAAPDCNVIRSRQFMTTKAENLVPGEIVQLTVGDIVPADLRLMTAVNFATDEAMLTGESKPCTKDAEMIFEDNDLPIGDRTNIAYSSTVVTRGRASGIVFATAMDTEIGKIAQLLRESGRTQDKTQNWPIRTAKSAWHGLKSGLGLIGTPLQVKLSYFALILFALAILLAIIVFSANSWEIDNETLIYAICVGVAVIPESLIAVLTITIATGSKAMARGNVVVRKMGSLEAIGAVTNICSDKTGTLTQGKMLARKALLPSQSLLTVDGEGSPFNPETGTVKLNDHIVDRNIMVCPGELQSFFHTVALCNLSTISAPTDSGLWSATGEPTEIALQILAMRVGQSKKDILADHPMTLLAEHGFDSAIKRMSVVYQDDRTGSICSYTKGATEVLLPLLSLGAEQQKDILARADSMAADGLRVLCLAHQHLDPGMTEKVSDRDFIEQNITFGGLVGLYDPPRLESAGAIRQCQAAGITVHMLTGDHLKTATTIAKEIGILGPQVPSSASSTAVMTALEFDKLSDRELDQMETLPFVLARCSPSSKLRMLHALHRRGRYCVMTGDGVNDAPSLKGADVGVAMGLNGSDVSKEAADMVLTDDNFASIVSAIREGRRLFDNIQKFLLHLLISNISQVILLLVGLAFQDRYGISVFPLSPIEILWANLITSSFLAIGLGLEGASADIMTRPPHSLKAGVFTKELIVDKFIYGSIMGCLCLVSYVIVVFRIGDGDLGIDCNENFNETCDLAYRARGTAYSVLTVLLSVMALEAKHLTHSLFNLNPGSGNSLVQNLRLITQNRFLFIAVCVGMVTPFPIIYIPVVNHVVFRHDHLDGADWGLVFGSLVLFVAMVEAWKASKRRRLRSRDRVAEDRVKESSEGSSFV
ncbi:hypothetical protein LTR78_005085 [Recurvomyces mirabilis]|uniref:P-type Na(+) transporter n=1 Tax=Recurvomyces mirabilis TaxID=574656 RepID=A0AAE1C227_9PEZI|nr:hypothetical protein LTR78_005085 [Recurvomyces mirabilis]KAK5158298.1 hypothetical protein LTS14_003316 [Recurvomyces mirabilis]